MKVYKVLTDMKSQLHQYMPQELVIKYEPGVWIWPKVGLIFCYKNIPALPPSNIYEQVWEAEAMGTQQLLYALDLFQFTSVQEFTDFWSHVGNYASEENLWFTNKSTIGCTAIKLIRQTKGGE